MYDETQLKIINATMQLIMEMGYSYTTTKNIAKTAKVNECTIFRRFKGKKEIVLSAMELPEWNPGLAEEDFIINEETKDYEDIIRDLISYCEIYMRKVTPQMVRISIGLRTPELQGAAIPGIMKIPKSFKNAMIAYFDMLIKKNLISSDDESDIQYKERLAMQFVSMNVGFVFLKASFGNNISNVSKDDYIKCSVKTFVHGIMGENHG